MAIRMWLDRKPTSSQSTPLHKKNDVRVGDQVTINNLSGTIRFIGATEFKAGTWIGIELDKVGSGKNDGSVQGKRYFDCPPKTGLFILASKLLKQQQHQIISNRPLTPHHKVNTESSSSTLPYLPSPPYNNNTLTHSNPPIHSSTPLMSPKSPPLPLPPPLLPFLATPSTENKLKIRIKTLELENKQLKDTIEQDRIKHEKLESRMNKLRQTSVESIEILEKMLQSQYDKVVSLQTKSKLDQQILQRSLKDVSVLEFVLQSRLQKESYLIDLIRKERQYNSKIERRQTETKWVLRERLDTPIEEEEDNVCPLCDQKGHELIHCPAP